MKKRMMAGLVLILVLTLLTGCGGAAKNSAADMEMNSMGARPMEPTNGTDFYAEEFRESDDSYEYSDAGGTYGATQIHLPNMPANSAEKIVYTTHLDIESLAFDENYAAIIAHLEECGGYIANSEMSGGVYSDGSSRSRYVWLELKVPVENYRAFLAGEDFGNIVFRNDSSENITNAYMDVEARLETLQVQEDRLLQLLEESGTLEDLLALEERLAEVRYEIERLTSTRNTYDERVRYCTVTINLNEVRRVTVTSDTFGARLRAAVSDSLDGVVEFFKDFVVFLVYLLPISVIVGVAVFFVVIVARRVRRNRRMRPRKEDVTESAAENPKKDDSTNAPRIL